jgi:hypothetical protein
MTRDQFLATLTDASPPADVDPILAALWHDRKGNWEASHAIAQSREGTQAYDRLHAYLHRKEGDVGNAGYWYRQARSPDFKGSLEAEWDHLVDLHLA